MYGACLFCRTWLVFFIFLGVMRVFLLFQAVSDAMLAELKACFMEAYDDNQDGKIDIREVSFSGNSFLSEPGQLCGTTFFVIGYNKIFLG